MTAVGRTIPAPTLGGLQPVTGSTCPRSQPRRSAPSSAVPPPRPLPTRGGRAGAARGGRGDRSEPRAPERCRRSHGGSGGPRPPCRLRARPHTPAGKAEEPPAPSPGRDGPRPAALRPAGTGEAGRQRVPRTAAPALPRPSLPAPPAAATEPPAPWLRLLPLSILSPMLPAGPEGEAPAGGRLGGCGRSSGAAGGRAERGPGPPRRCHGGGSAPGARPRPGGARPRSPGPGRRRGSAAGPLPRNAPRGAWEVREGFVPVGERALVTYAFFLVI